MEDCLYFFVCCIFFGTLGFPPFLFVDFTFTFKGQQSSMMIFFGVISLCVIKSHLFIFLMQTQLIVPLVVEEEWEIENFSWF